MQAKLLRSIIDNFESLKILWKWSLCNCSESEIKASFSGVDVNMRAFNYVFEAYLGEPISGQSDILSKSLQIYNLSAADVLCVANATMETLNSTRNYESFDSL